MNEKAVLITGGARYIGSHAVVFDNLSKIGRASFVKGDLRNKEDITHDETRRSFL